MTYKVPMQDLAASAGTQFPGPVRTEIAALVDAAGYVKATPPLAITSTSASVFALTLSHVNRIILTTGSSNTQIAIPSNASVAFPLGTQIMVAQMGTGEANVAGVVGVAVRATPGAKISAQYGRATLVKVGTDEWLLTGNLKA